VTRLRMLTVVVLVIALAIGGILTTQRVIAASDGIFPGLVLSLLGGAALLGVVFVVVALLGLRARRNPGKAAPVIAPRMPK